MPPINFDVAESQGFTDAAVRKSEQRQEQLNSLKNGVIMVKNAVTEFGDFQQKFTNNYKNPKSIDSYFSNNDNRISSGEIKLAEIYAIKVADGEQHKETGKHLTTDEVTNLYNSMQEYDINAMKTNFNRYQQRVDLCGIYAKDLDNLIQVIEKWPSAASVSDLSTKIKTEVKKLNTAFDVSYKRLSSEIQRGSVNLNMPLRDEKNFLGHSGLYIGIDYSEKTNGSHRITGACMENFGYKYNDEYLWNQFNTENLKGSSSLHKYSTSYDDYCQAHGSFIKRAFDNHFNVVDRQLAAKSR